MLFYILYIAIISVSIIGYFYYRKNKEKSKFDDVVSVYLIVISLDILNTVIFRELISGYQYVDLFAPFGLIYGPLLYFCILVAENRKLSNSLVFIHLLPFLLFLVLFITIVISDKFKLNYSKLIYNVLFSAFGISWIFYPIVVFIRANKSRHLIFQIKRLFYYSIILLFLISAFIIPLITTSIIHGTISRSPISEVIMYSIMLFASIIICNYYIRKYLQNNSTQLTKSKNSFVEGDEIQFEEYFNGNKILIYEELIYTYLAQKKYLNPNFSMDTMVEDLGISKLILNQFFKSNYNLSFINKINELRIEEACQELNSDNFDLNIDELAFRSGYSSRASFYRHFSKLKNCSPIEYRVEIKK